MGYCFLHKRGHGGGGGIASLIKTVSGVMIVISDSAQMPLQGLKLFGVTAQSGTPSPDDPVPLISAGDGGSITVSVGEQEITVSTPNGLPGVPVADGGNYTDDNGQQWICDEIDFDRGVYVQRIRTITFTGQETWHDYYPATTSSVGNYFIKPSSKVMCDYFPTVDNATNGYIAVRNLNASGFASVADFKVFLQEKYAQGDPPIFKYILETPAETDLPAETLAQYAALYTESPSTTIRNDGSAWMEATYISTGG